MYQENVPKKEPRRALLGTRFALRAATLLSRASAAESSAAFFSAWALDRRRDAIVDERRSGCWGDDREEAGEAAAVPPEAGEPLPSNVTRRRCRGEAPSSES